MLLSRSDLKDLQATQAGCLGQALPNLVGWDPSMQAVTSDIHTALVKQASPSRSHREAESPSTLNINSQQVWFACAWGGGGVQQLPKIHDRPVPADMQTAVCGLHVNLQLLTIHSLINKHVWIVKPVMSLLHVCFQSTVVGETGVLVPVHVVVVAFGF